MTENLKQTKISRAPMDHVTDASKRSDDVLPTSLHVCARFLINSLLMFFPHSQLLREFHFADITTTFTSVMV